MDLDCDKLPVERALGLLWCVETNSFLFKIELKQQMLTRCGMLSTISSVYDLLGFLSPVTLPAKMMLQELCRRGWGWDDSLPLKYPGVSNQQRIARLLEPNCIALTTSRWWKGLRFFGGMRRTGLTMPLMSP